MERGGTRDLGFAKITMVRADHVSVVKAANANTPSPAGLACGYIVNIPNHNLTIYHASNTNIFGDM